MILFKRIFKIILSILFIIGILWVNFDIDEEKERIYYSNNNDTKLLLKDRIDKNLIYGIMIDFVKYGFADYYQQNNREYIYKIAKNKGFRLYSTPLIDARWKHNGRDIHQLVRITLTSRHIFSDLFCEYQEEYSGYIYEYWMLKQWIEKSQKSPSAYLECSFFITKALSRKGERNIIYKSTHFFPEYIVDEKFSVVFPRNKLYTLSSHGFTSCP